MKPPPTLTLTIPALKKRLEVPLTTAAWNVWRVATYPLAILAGYYFFGRDGALMTVCLLALTNRGSI